VEKHLPNILQFIFVTLSAILFLFLGSLFRPSKKINNAPYGGGEDGVSNPWVKNPPQFQHILAVSIVVSLGIFFIMPAIVHYRTWALDGKLKEVFAAIGIFIFTIFFAMFYAWKKGDLDWK